MFITKKHISRRTMLRGMGATVALPFLESMMPAMTHEATPANPLFDSPASKSCTAPPEARRFGASKEHVVACGRRP